jgi:GNAT superfamily N-acetyltransferase
VIDIRSLGPDDWLEIRDVRLRSLADAPEAFTSKHDNEAGYDEARWRQMASTGRWFVAADGELVGVAVGVNGPPGAMKTRELVGMWVAPSHRRRGVARALLDAVKAWAVSDGAITLRLGVREGNDQARAAYLRMGMCPSGEREPEVDHPARVIEFLECDLASA